MAKRKAPKKKAVSTVKKQKVSKSHSKSIGDLLPWIILIASLSVYFVARINFIDIPLNRDEGTYSYLGKIAISGGIPYWDFYEMKPPGLYYFYGLLGSIFGYGESGLRIGMMILNLINAWVIFKISGLLFKEKSSAIVAASFFLIYSLSGGIFGHSAVAEQPVILFSLPSFYFILRNQSHRDLVMAGIFMAIAMTMKQSSIFLFLFASTFVIIQSLMDDKDLRTTLFRYLKFLMPIAIIGITVLMLLYYLGNWDEFVYWLYTHSLGYIDTGADTEKSTLFYFLYFANRFIVDQWPVLLWGLLGVLTFAFKWKSNRKLVYFLGLFLMFSFIAIFPGWRFYSQYWILLIPGLAMATGALYELVSGYDKRMVVALGIVLIASIGLDFYSNMDYYLVKDQKAISERLFTGNPYHEIKELCNFLNTQKKEGDRLFVLGSEPQAHIYTDIDALTRHVYPALLTAPTSTNAARQEEAFRILESTRPEFILMNIVPFSWNIQSSDNSYLYSNGYAFATNNYTPIAVADYGIGGSYLAYGNKAKTYQFRSSTYIILYRKK